ncbi:SPOR domain-containing protein [Algibacter aquimarinus]|uniref:SPOR domain-containing protein n=1 Tax=Algibacter aquimarinus TaxID=1136748 RepID=A0ABP9HJN8_9FLAO
MKRFNLKTSILAILFLLIASAYGFSQQGSVTVNQDQKITELLDLKKEMNKSETNSDLFRIQIYNGNVRSGAYSAQKEFLESFSEWPTKVLFENPEFKTWVGVFRSRLEADRALKRVKRKFPNAFILKPKKE